MVLYNIEKVRQRLRTDSVHESFTRENAKVKGRDHWCKWYGLAHPVNILNLQYLANRRKSEEHLFILQTVLYYSGQQSPSTSNCGINNRFLFCSMGLARGPKFQWLCRIYKIVFRPP